MFIFFTHVSICYFSSDTHLHIRLCGLNSHISSLVLLEHQRHLCVPSRQGVILSCWSCCVVVDTKHQRATSNPAPGHLIILLLAGTQSAHFKGPSPLFRLAKILYCYLYMFDQPSFLPQCGKTNWNQPISFPVRWDLWESTIVSPQRQQRIHFHQRFINFPNSIVYFKWFFVLMYVL